MNGICGILSLDTISIDENAFIESINLANTMNVNSVSEENLFSVVSFLDSAPLKGKRIYKTKDLIFFFGGDLIGYNEIPWVEIESNFSKSNYEWFSTLRGFFSFVVYNKNLKQISLISDVTGQTPLYYGYLDNSFVFSTDLSTFATLQRIPEFNIKWLYEYMFFNFPIDNTTFFKNVNKLRALSIVKFDLNLQSIEESTYGECFKTSKNILIGNEALDKCIESFKKIIPRYYSEEGVNLTAISGGFDSRTLLSLAPSKSKVIAYTYGVKGSGDLNTVSRFIKKLNFKHTEVFFNEDFKKSLPSLIHDTVRLSGGTQSIIRSTLLYAYRSLFNEKKEISLVMGGLAGDFFRGDSGYSNNFATVSRGMRDFLLTGEARINEEVYGNMFNNKVVFEDHIKNTYKKIKTRYGDPLKPEAKMSYDVYEIYPKYFAGEIAIANNYFNFRAPFLDTDLVNLIYETEIGNLDFSLYNKSKEESKRISHKKLILQSRVISANPKFKNTYIKGKPLSVYTHDKPLSKLSKFIIRGFAYLRGHRPSKEPMEDWENWFKHDLKDEFDRLLNNESLLLKYFNKDLVWSVKKSNDIYLLNKLVTIEIILNLIKNRWNITCDYNKA